jgi:hypothetical protein
MDIEQQIIKTATDIIQPVMESAMILAGHYCKACERNTLTGEDLKYCMKYCARNLVGKQIGTLFPEDDEEDESDSDSDDSIEVVDEDDEPFTRYTGEDPLMNDINQASDTWNEWIPSSPMESMLKDSINTSY